MTMLHEVLSHPDYWTFVGVCAALITVNVWILNRA